MFNKKSLISAVAASMVIASSAQAATILGFGVEADYYNPQASGSLTYKGDVANTTTDFGGKRDSTYQIGAFFEHPVPLVPNLRVDYTPMKLGATTTVNTTSGSLTAGVAATNSITLKALDVTPYYEILDNIVSLDIGITARSLSASIDTRQGATLVSESKSIVLPMGYLAAEVKLPLTGLRVNADLKCLGFNGDKYMDGKAKVSYDFFKGFGAEAGYRYQNLKLNHFNFDADVTFKGPFVGMNFVF